MTSKRFQPFCKKHNINIGCFDTKYRLLCSRKNFRSITERHGALYMYKNHFCLIWESNGIRFKKAIEELKLNFKVDDSVISDKRGKSFIEDEYKITKVQSQLTNMIIYDLKAFNTDRAVPYAFGL